MRSISLVILFLAAAAWAQESVPPPRIMLIYMKDGTIDSIACSRLDPESGVSFFKNRTMKVSIKDIVDPIQLIIVPSTKWYCTSQIDSITFPFISPPVETPAETPVETPADVPIN